MHIHPWNDYEYMVSMFAESYQQYKLWLCCDFNMLQLPFLFRPKNIIYEIGTDELDSFCQLDGIVKFRAHFKQVKV